MSANLWPIIWLSLRVTGLALTVSAVIGIPIGAWLGLARFRGQSVFAVLVYTLMGLPPVVVGLLVYLLLSKSGPLAFLNWLFTPEAMTLAQIVIALPVVTGITLSAVSAVPAELSSQLKSLGATPRQIRLTILFEARSGVLVGIIAAFGRIISEVGAALMVGGNIQGHTRVLTTAIVLETQKGDFSLALALGGWLMILTLMVSWILFQLQGRPTP